MELEKKGGQKAVGKGVLLYNFEIPIVRNFIISIYELYLPHVQHHAMLHKVPLWSCFFFIRKPLSSNRVRYSGG